MQITSGLDALNMLNDEGQGGQQNEFSSLKSGDSRKVKVIEFGDFIGVHTYSIFRVVNTFTPEKMPKLSAKGYPVDGLTPFDKAWKYHKDLSEEFGDHHSTESSKYRLKPRFAFGFYDLDEKKPIVLDFSKKQAQGLIQVIQKQSDQGRLGKRAFELSKSGSGTGTTVSLTPEIIEDLSPEQAKAFEEAPDEFDKTLFDGLYYVMNEEQQIEALTQAGFDVSLIGYSPNQGKSQTEENPYAAPETLEDPTQQF